MGPERRYDHPPRWIQGWWNPLREQGANTLTSSRCTRSRFREEKCWWPLLPLNILIPVNLQMIASLDFLLITCLITYTLREVVFFPPIYKRKAICNGIDTSVPDGSLQGATNTDIRTLDDHPSSTRKGDDASGRCAYFVDGLSTRKRFLSTRASRTSFPCA
jgi:hypothetical protein